MLKIIKFAIIYNLLKCKKNWKINLKMISSSCKFVYLIIVLIILSDLRTKFLELKEYEFFMYLVIQFYLQKILKKVIQNDFYNQCRKLI